MTTGPDSPNEAEVIPPAIPSDAAPGDTAPAPVVHLEPPGEQPPVVASDSAEPPHVPPVAVGLGGEDGDDGDAEPENPFSDDIYAAPLESFSEPNAEQGDSHWYILKVQVNREDSIRDALVRRVKMNGLEVFFKEIVVPTEDVAEFTKTGKRRIVKKKIYPGYILVNMILTEESWFLVRETGGIGDFTGSQGKPSPMDQKDVDAILRRAKPVDEESAEVKSAIPFKPQDKVRIKEGNFLNFEGEVVSIDQAHGRVRVTITIFGRATPVDFQHWMLERL